MASRRAGSVSLSSLRAAIDKAAKAVPGAVGAIEPGFEIHPGMIFGRVLRADEAKVNAEALAKEITTEFAPAAKKAGVTGLSPAVLKVNKQIIIGFVGPNLGSLSIKQ